jgi:hypothetical protein
MKKMNIFRRVLASPNLVICKGLRYSIIRLSVLILFLNIHTIDSIASAKFGNPPDKINLPTEDYGIRQVENFLNGSYHQLVISKERSITTYNHGNKYPLAPFELSDIPEFPYINNNDQWTTEAPPYVFQAHWITDKISRYYSQYLNINFTKIRVKVCGYGEWRAWTPLTSIINDAIIVIHNRTKANGELSTWAEFDVIAHELCHTYLFNYVQWEKEKESSAIHEGICDMFGVYFEHKYLLENNHNAAIDWKFGNSIDPDYVRRDLENPEYPCYSEEVANLEDEHDRGQPLGHWFYLLCEGASVEENSCVMGIGIEKGIQIVKNSIETLTLSSDIGYSEFRDATMTYVVNEYGLLSNEANTLRWAWDKICIPTSTLFNSTIPIIINSSSNPNNYVVFGDIVVEGNTNLILKGTYKMLSNATITLNNSSKLKLTECSLEGCSSQKWSGIVADNNNASENKSILTLPPSIIKNARTGIRLKGDNITCNIVDLKFLENDIGLQFENFSNEAIINGSVKFIDNLQGIVYKNSPKKIEISNCEFSAPGIINDGSDDKIPSGISFEGSGGDNIINSCKFKDLTTGIESVDSKISANNNQFENCSAAITTLASGPANGSLKVNNMNYFLNCPKGIDFSGLDVNGVIIQDNLFENCSNTIYGQGSNSFSIIDNTFYGGAKNIEIAASGNSMNTIDCNVINYPSEGGIGIYEENLNTSFMGNSFQNTGIYDIHIDGSVKEKIGSDNQAPLNYFSTNHTNDITITNHTDAFKYYVSPTPPANTDPDNSENTDIPANWEDYTELNFTGPDCEIPPGNEATNFVLWVDYYCQLLREYKLHPSKTLERRIKLLESDLKRVLWNYFTLMFGGDNFTKDNWIRFWNQILLSYCNSYYTLKPLYYMSVKAGDCNRADSLLTMIEQSMLLPPDGTRLDSLERLDKQSFITINRIGLRYYCDQLRVDSSWVTRDSFMFNSRDIAILHQETYRLIPESAYARTLYYIATNELLMPTLGDMQFRSDTPAKSIKPVEMSVYPNPADGKVAISFNKPVDGMLTVYDILGNTLLNETLSNRLIYEYDTTPLKNGIYIVTVSSDEGNIIKSEKLILNH